MLRKLILTFLYVFVPLAAVAVTYHFVESYFLTPANPAATQHIVVDFTPDKSLKALASELESKGLVRTSLSLRVIARLKKQDTLLKAGEYELSPSMTPEQILDKLARGEMVLRRFTVKEGMRAGEIGALVEAAGIAHRAEVDAALADPSLLSELNLPGGSFEGYLFPETYSFPRDTSGRKIVAAMKQQFDAKWKPEWDARAKGLGRTKHEIVTLASIIEKESGNVEEQPKIAGVFYNRLRLGMKLQADPTVIYGIRDFNGNITKEDLLTPTPYNTYVITGLPPGPIANPGLSALTAALFPEQSTYLYFVGNGAGRHIFSTNLADHNSAVNEFQRGGSGTTQVPQAPPTETTPIAAQPTAQPPAQQSTAPAAP